MTQMIDKNCGNLKTSALDLLGNPRISTLTEKQRVDLRAIAFKIDPITAADGIVINRIIEKLTPRAA